MEIHPANLVTNALLQLQGLAVADGLWAFPGIITLCVLLVHKLDIPGDEQKSGFQMLLGLDVFGLRSEFGLL